jgi:ribonucleoside-diphosphate reductase alpha chain
MISTGFLAMPLLDDTLADDKAVPSRGGLVGPICPKCSQPGLVKEAGCLSCFHCGWSKCS